MTYLYRCPKCERTHEVSHGMKEEPSVGCVGCEAAMHRVPQVAFFTAMPVMQRDENRWHGSRTEKLEMQKKYNPDTQEKRDEKILDKSTVEAQMAGRDIVTPKQVDKEVSLMDMCRKAAQDMGVSIRGG